MSLCSPPPCGEGLGVGVAVGFSNYKFYPPSLSLPRKGEETQEADHHDLMT